MALPPSRLALLVALLLAHMRGALTAAGDSSSSGSNATEAAALLAFRAALTSSEALADWGAGDMCTAPWTGVVCSATGQVTKL